MTNLANIAPLIAKRERERAAIANLPLIFVTLQIVLLAFYSSRTEMKTKTTNRKLL